MKKGQGRDAETQSGMGNSSVGLSPQAPSNGVSEGSDDRMQNGWHNRSYNPANDAKRAKIGATLNSDAARYKKGPGPA